ncbi:unnamed protein product [Parnassius apollo]|uniref:(apollo) hypothetical protein n=1 Tax=Parnassius apollo TaxID=110799 RepID=A0A8S3XTC6_PARAO|nr:unnamed protein product [Parnassius apollo]
MFRNQDMQQLELKKLKENKSKLCLSSSIDRKGLAGTVRKKFNTNCEMYHYRVPGGGIRQLLCGLHKDYTWADYCVIIIGVSDFETQDKQEDMGIDEFDCVESSSTTEVQNRDAENCASQASLENSNPVTNSKVVQKGRAKNPPE